LKFLTRGAFYILVMLIIQCGEKKEGKVIGNNPPVIDKVTLLPSNPTTQSEISARIMGLDKDGDPITYTVKWFVNGKEIGEGMSLKYEEIHKGDKIYVEVTPYDGKEWGKSTKSGELTVGGLPPRILSVKISPESLFITTPQVVVSAMVEDPDGDSIKLIIHWLVKDEVIPNTSNVLDLKKFNLKKDDVITASAFADDGEFKSEPFPFELHIANSAPIFKTKADSIRCRPDSIYYPIPIVDPDGDPLTFEILEAPEGIEIDNKKGIIYGDSGDTTAFEVLIRAIDPDGAYLDAKFTLTPPK